MSFAHFPDRQVVTDTGTFTWLRQIANVTPLYWHIPRTQGVSRICVTLLLLLKAWVKFQLCPNKISSWIQMDFYSYLKSHLQTAKIRSMLDKVKSNQRWPARYPYRPKNIHSGMFKRVYIFFFTILKSGWTGLAWLENKKIWVQVSGLAFHCRSRE